MGETSNIRYRRPDHQSVCSPWMGCIRVTGQMGYRTLSGSERTQQLRVHSLPAVGLSALRVPVMGVEVVAGGGCVLFEKCIVDASISHMRYRIRFSGLVCFFVGYEYCNFI